MPLADFQLLFKIGLSKLPAQSPFLKSYSPTSRSRNRLPNKMNRTESGHQNKSRRIDSNDEDHRADGPEGGAKQTAVFIGEEVSDPTARRLNVHRHFQPEQVADVPQLVEACTGYDEQHDPGNSGRHTQPRMKQFRRAETEQNCCQQQRSENANALIANSRHNRAYRTNEILRRMIGRRNMAKPDPGRHVLWGIGDQRKKEQRADEK